MGDIRGQHTSPGVYTRIRQKKVQNINNNLDKNTTIKSSPNSYDKIYMFVDGSNYKGDLLLVEHTINNIKWTIKDQNGIEISTSNQESITVENGAKVDYYGEWMYFNREDGEKLPTSCEGSWGSILPESEEVIPYESQDITSSTTFSQTIKAAQKGLLVRDNKVVLPDKTVDFDKSTVSNTVTFKHLIYFGASDKTSISSLSDLQTLTSEFVSNLNGDKKLSNITCIKNYAYIAWPKTLGKKIWNIGGLDNQPIEETITITNMYGKDIEYIITRSENVLDATITVILKS
jgi:hypothetical protein